MEKKKYLLALAVASLVSASAFAQDFRVASVSGERILIDSHYADDAEGADFLAPYRHEVDSVMSPLVGKSAKYMKSFFPESELGNLLADIMLWSGSKYDEHPDVGMYNLGGIRAALPSGDVTFGDVVDIAPFENKICFLSLTGKQLKTLFTQMMSRGAAVSKGIEAEYLREGKELKLTSLKLDGKKISDKKMYRIATIDYLIQGNDGFRELRNAKELKIYTDESANTRVLIADYFREKMAAGEVVDSKIEGRIKVIRNDKK